MTFPSSGPRVIRPDWRVAPVVQACCTTRVGGVSVGPYGASGGQGGLNLGSHVGDRPEAVAINRRRVVDGPLGGARPVWLEQVHGTAVVELGPDLPLTPPVADAAWTREPGIACTIMTADCLPVLLADRAGRMVGAAHAGWRGLADGVLQATVSAMRDGHRRAGDSAKAGGAELDLVAWVGPHIGATAFEIGPEVRTRFLDVMPGEDDAFELNAAGRWLGNLARLARRALREAGVGEVFCDSACTVADPSYFYSYRRDHITGRIASFIWLAV
ncbi:peptidoglycan editing factor PgeF [Derxia gummosa]|uniref:Purine nucleoside phosphorylase n=1 Tax=Derxia gummosa DSM 723 TaxID=1121388 RepID=A0A8B6X4L0_9BURK|nr:peptidoglycan editing factor PgeF [Derxia gummosa]